jgi:hypothetical protein
MFAVNRVKRPEPVIGPESQLPRRTDCDGSLQRFAVSRFYFRLEIQLLTNRLVYQGMVLGGDRTEVPLDLGVESGAKNERYVELVADRPRRVVGDLTMSGHGGLAAVSRVRPDRMPLALAQ